jgi:exopolysaccharide biosynthesis predicted pyruvyltransferase EpsI
MLKLHRNWETRTYLINVHVQLQVVLQKTEKIQKDNTNLSLVSREKCLMHVFGSLFWSHCVMRCHLF